MKLNPVIILFLCMTLCGNIFSQSKDIDKELTDLADKLAKQIKENAKKKVTVIDFTDLEGGVNDLGKYIAEQLTVNLVMAKKDFSVLDRANLKSILAEHKLTATGLIDPENAKQLGKFAGVDVLILGTIVIKSEQVTITAKMITTDTAEIIGATRGEFKVDPVVQELLSKTVAAGAKTDTSQSAVPLRPPIVKPFGDLHAKVESIKFLPSSTPEGYVNLTLVVTNMSTSKTYGVAFEPDADNIYNRFHLNNSRGDDFQSVELTGIGLGSYSTGKFNGTMTDIAPKTSLTIISKCMVRWNGTKSGDYRPYRFRAMVILGEENNGQYDALRKYNLVIDVK